jgi:adenosine/AMP kinase
MEKIQEIPLTFPDGCNIILGYSHFIKTVEDLDEIIKTIIPNSKYSLSFSEASGERLIRYEGNDSELMSIGIENLRQISCGHTFLIILRDAYPISVLNAIKGCQEVGGIFASTANPVTVIIYRGANGGSILGVIDGFSPLEVEGDDDKLKRKELLRRIGYKK